MNEKSLIGICSMAIILVILVCFFCSRPLIPVGMSEEDILKHAMDSKEQAIAEASSKAGIEEHREYEKNIQKAQKICESVGLHITDIEYDPSLKKNCYGERKKEWSYGTGIVIHTNNFVFHVCQSNNIGVCRELVLVPIEIKYLGDEEWSPAFERDFVPYCPCADTFAEYYLVLGEHRSAASNYKNLGNIGLTFIKNGGAK